MSLAAKLPQVILIVGPTAVGKTSLSIDLAKRIGGEIISADSRYMYRGMNIGTAKPGLEDRWGIPHHLIDVADPDESWSLARFLECTYQLVDEILGRKKIPIIVGGTGQYMRALLEGWQLPEFEPMPQLRQVLGDWSLKIGPKELHHKLSIVDADAAEFIDFTNVRRTIRALEVIFSTGQGFSKLRRKTSPAYDYWVIGLQLDREELYKRIDDRIEVMFNRGLIDEVGELLEQGYQPDIPSMTAIGYTEVIQYIEGEITLEYAKTLMRSRTRQFIRRQANWFKSSDESIHWYEMDPYPIEDILSDWNAAKGKG